MSQHPITLKDQGMGSREPLHPFWENVFQRTPAVPTDLKPENAPTNGLARFAKTNGLISVQRKGQAEQTLDALVDQGIVTQTFADRVSAAFARLGNPAWLVCAPSLHHKTILVRKANPISLRITPSNRAAHLIGRAWHAIQPYDPSAVLSGQWLLGGQALQSLSRLDGGGDSGLDYTATYMDGQTAVINLGQALYNGQTQSPRITLALTLSLPDTASPELLPSSVQAQIQTDGDGVEPLQLTPGSYPSTQRYSFTLPLRALFQSPTPGATQTATLTLQRATSEDTAPDYPPTFDFTSPL